MRNLSTAYKSSASGDARNYTINLHVWKKSVDDNGNVSFPSSSKATYTSGNDLISMSIVDGQTSGNSFQLGQTFCPIISFSTVPNLNIKTGDKVQVELVFTSSAKATLATGYVDEYSYDSIDYAVSYTAYGKMLQLDKDYNSALTYPATFAAIVGEICSQNGMAFDTFDWKCNAKLKAKPIFGNLDNGDPAYPSAREMLGIIAGVNGCNVIITANEKVKFVPYTDTKTGITYEDAFSRQVNNEKYVIKKAVLNDGGQTSGDEAGYVELYFPLETVEGKASCLEKLNSVITGLSVMGMTVQTQGRGYYEIGDMLSYTDFDGEKYTLGVMGIKYDFGGGYFTETLYSLAPSEMEEQYKGNVRYSSASTTLKNPIVLSENTSSYLQYNYTVIGYRKGDKLTEAEGSKSFFIGGFKIANDWAEDSLNGNQALSFDDLAPHIANGYYPKNLRASFRIDEVLASGATRWALDYSYLDTSTGENVVRRGANFVTTNGIAPLFLTQWLRIHSPSETYPYGYAELDIIVKYYNQHGALGTSRTTLPQVIEHCNPCFTSIAEYNAAINLTSEPLIAYDVSQEVMQIVEGDTPADLPEYGNSKTLYLTTTPAASWKYDVFNQKYVCVGRNYRELQRIKSSTEESTALEVFNVPVIFDCRTKTEWELEANTVYPKGFMIFEQEVDTREVTKVKIANGIDKLSDLKYTNVTENELPTSLPANGGTADVAKKLTDWGTTYVTDADNAPLGLSRISNGGKNNPYTFWATLLTSGADDTDGYRQQWAFPWGGGEAPGKPKYRVKDNGTWFAWQSLPDGGNADTVDGKHASDFATAEDVSSAVSAIQIGVRNLLLNSSFEKNSQDWITLYQASGSNSTFELDFITKYNKKCAHFSMSGFNQLKIVGQSILSKLEPNTEYTFSGWVLTENVVQGTTDYFARLHLDGAYTDESGNSQYLTYGNDAPFTVNGGVGKWKYVSYTFTTDETKLSNAVTLTATVYTRDLTGDIYFCDLKLEKGNKPTDWTPAPEDDERRIASLEARVAALEAAAVSGGE